ncbi:cyclase family protein [Halomicrobium salinisoli]|uniref:cyclase family protein n=1 Tax=Halomicrobium salinisoli TaxID=2878391 RepID=UPI001CF084E9|nr:cyclase family protein [Halomicrobium salinisoli]
MSNDRSDDSDDGRTATTATRRRVLRAWAAAASIGVVGVTLPEQVAAQEYKDSGVTVNEIWTDVLSRLPDNWGRWGEDDEIGTLNYLDGEQAARGMQTAMQGPPGEIQVFTLQPPYRGEVIPTPEAGDPTETGDPLFPTREPARRDQIVDDRHYEQGFVEPLEGGMKFSDDAFITRLFLQGSAQLDALAHVWYDTKKRPGQEELADERRGLLYNGFEASTLSTAHEYDEPVSGLRPAADPENDLEDVPEDYDPFSTDLVEHPVTRTWEAGRVGAAKQAEHGAVGRAVLLDVGRNGPDDLERSDDNETRLAQGVGVELDHLRATAEAQGVSVEQRDILLVRMGGTEKTLDPEAEWTTEEPGLSFSQDLIEWLHEKEVPVIAADNLAVEVLAEDVDPQADLSDELRGEVEDAVGVALDEPFLVTNPNHPALITNLGIPVHEILLLDELAESCDEDGVYEMLFAGAPLKIPGGDGSPINPIAVKASRPAGGDGSGSGSEGGEGGSDEGTD